MATQIAVEAGNLTRHHAGFQIRVLLGGESKKRQVREWEGRKDIVVCTPGRILDLIDSVPKFSEPLKYTQMVSDFFFYYLFFGGVRLFFLLRGLQAKFLNLAYSG